MLRKLKWQIPGERLAARYNWCQGPVPGRGPAVEKHWSMVWRWHAEDKVTLAHTGPHNAHTIFRPSPERNRPHRHHIPESSLPQMRVKACIFTQMYPKCSLLGVPHFVTLRHVHRCDLSTNINEGAQHAKLSLLNRTKPSRQCQNGFIFMSYDY